VYSKSALDKIQKAGGAAEVLSRTPAETPGEAENK
jgi:hypothetical protein